MRYKNNVLDKLTQLETSVNRIQVQVNRNMSQDQILESVDFLKEGIEAIREMIAIEGDDFEQQFRPQ
jgi:DNA-binding transcriptional regulator YiaG